MQVTFQSNLVNKVTPKTIKKITADYNYKEAQDKINFNPYLSGAEKSKLKITPLKVEKACKKVSKLIKNNFKKWTRQAKKADSKDKIKIELQNIDLNHSIRTIGDSRAPKNIGVVLKSKKKNIIKTFSLFDVDKKNTQKSIKTFVESNIKN